MCENPCVELKAAVCQHEHGCEGPFFMPCNSTCFEFDSHWPKRVSENYKIPACDTCDKNKN